MKNWRYFILAVPLLVSGCATRMTASDYPRQASYAYDDTSSTTLAHAYAKSAAAHPGKAGFHLLPNGTEALMMRIALIEASQKSVDLQYFSTRDDTTGKLLLEALSRAAQRGVRVRMLLDDWNLDDFESGAVALDSIPNIEVRIFNPYSSRDENFIAHLGNVIFDADHFTHRMHNKAMIVDNQAAIIGGRNLGDEYFDASTDIDFRDADMFTVGTVTRKISQNFDRYWNSDQAFTLESLNIASVSDQKIQAIRQNLHIYWRTTLASRLGKHLSNMPLPNKVKTGGVPLIWAKAELISDNPSKADDTDVTEQPKPQSPHEAITALIKGSKKECIIFTPYFVPDEAEVALLIHKVESGVRIRIVTNSLASTDMVPAQAGYSHYRAELVKGGVELYEVKSTSSHGSVKAMFKPSSQNGLHAKIYMADREDIAIGSFNFDNRSKNINTEQILVIHSEALGQKIGAMFQDIASPDISYHLTLANRLPPNDSHYSSNDDIVWETTDNGQKTYFDFNPHAGFLRTITDQIFGALPIEGEL